MNPIETVCDECGQRRPCWPFQPRHRHDSERGQGRCRLCARGKRMLCPRHWQRDRLADDKKVNDNNQAVLPGMQESIS